MQIVMVGSGYVGLVSGTCLAEVGHNVVCVDLDKNKIRLLQDGHSPIFEPGLNEMIRRNIHHERLRFTTELAESLDGADVIFIAVGTPEGEDGSADLSHVRTVATSIGQALKRDALVVVKSTVPVGTCDMVEEAIKEQLAHRGQDLKVSVASNPEFLKEGDAISDFMRPERIVVGLNETSAKKIFVELYRPFILDDSGRLIFMDRRSSELTKYAANSMLATRISFMNELAMLCEQVGANIDKVRHGMGTDSRIGKKFLFPGPGYGGSCFPKDVAALLKTGQEVGTSLQVLNAVFNANEQQKIWVSDKILAALESARGKRVAVWGLAFKPGTDDVRETPAFPIIDRLLAAGVTVTAHDPKARANFSKEFGERDGLSYVENAYDALKGVDALVLITEWSEYRRPNWDKVSGLMAHKLVIDLRNQFEAEDLMRRDFSYSSVGRPKS